MKYDVFICEMPLPTHSLNKHLLNIYYQPREGIGTGHMAGYIRTLLSLFVQVDGCGENMAIYSVYKRQEREREERWGTDLGRHLCMKQRAGAC